MVNLRLLIAGTFVLLLGSMVYVVDRPPGNLTLVTEWISLYDQRTFVFGSLGNNLPAFAHVFAFCLVTGSLLPQSRATALAVCIAWFTIDTAFEIGQHDAVWPVLRETLTGAGMANGLTTPMLDYFRFGRFDPADLVAIGCGALSAYLAIRLLSMYTRYRSGETVAGT